MVATGSRKPRAISSVVKTAHRPERQRHLRLHGQRRMAASENQPQLIVHHGSVRQIDLGLFQHGKLFDLRMLFLKARTPSKLIHHAIAGRGHQPRVRTGRRSIARPLLQRSHKRILHRFFG